jgi:hypothetical protein
MLIQTPSHRVLSVLGLTAALAVLPSCGDQGVEVHEVAKGVESTPPVVDPPAVHAPAATGEVTQVAVELPEGWTLDPTPRPMRVATYIITDPGGPVEVALTRFPGDTGGVLGNINRWRQQVGLGPVTEAELPATVRSFAEGRGYGVEIENGDRTLLGAGVFDAASGQTWFLKTTTTPAIAARVRAGFERVAASMAQTPTPGGSAAP